MKQRALCVALAPVAAGAAAKDWKTAFNQAIAGVHRDGTFKKAEGRHFDFAIYSDK